jgi:predicted aspartyl protease
MMGSLASWVILQVATQLAAPVEAPFTLMDNAIIVEALVNGKKASFMFDSGFGGYLILRDDMNVGKPTGTVGLRDFVTTFEAQSVPLKTLKIGTMEHEYHDADIVQLPVADLTQAYRTHVDGIMGLSVIKDFVTEINFENKKFVFHPKSLDVTKRQPDNKRTFLIKMEDTGYNSIELACKVNGHKLLMSLDTGNSGYAVTYRESLIRAGLWDPKQKPKYIFHVGVASGAVEAFSVWIKDSEIFGVPVEASVWEAIDRPSSDVESDGTIGFDFLKNFNIIIDYERRYVWLENWTGKVTEIPPAEPGIRVAKTAKNEYVVFEVISDSPAAEKGLKEGDIIKAIDGKPLSMVSPAEVRKLLQGAEGTICNLAISRDGVLRRFEVPRKLLVNGQRD